VETNHGKLAMGRRLDSSATAVAATLGMALVVAVVAGAPPHSSKLAREAPA
jgi:hypothetical protein